MPSTIFVDTAFWVALFYPQDEHNPGASVYWAKVVADGADTVTTNWTLYETLTLLNSSLGRFDLAQSALRLITASSQVVHIEAAGLEARSLDIFLGHADKR